MPTRRRRNLLTAITIGAATLLSAQAAHAGPATTSLVSVSSTGVVGNHRSGEGVVSADGRFVAFWSEATNLVPNDTNGFSDVFLRDRKTGETKRISVSNAGAQGNLYSYSPAISADGHYVYFLFDGNTLVPGASGPRVYRYDRVAQSLSVVPLPSDGSLDAEDDTPSVSADGSRVVFSLFTPSPSSKRIYWWDANTNQVRLVSTKADGGLPSGNTTSEYFNISGDGHHVVFSTNATDLVSGTDTNGTMKDVVIKNLDSGAIERVSTTSAGQQGNADSNYPSVSANGCLVAFYSNVISLVAGQTTAPNDFVKDRCGGGSTEVVSDVTPTGYFPDISANGCRVGFLASGSTSLRLRDRCAGGVSRVDISSDGVAGNSTVHGVDISPGTGRYIAFDSLSTNFDPADTTTGTDGEDVYVRDLATNTAPTAALKASVSGPQVTVDGTGSADPDGWILNGSINYGDGTPLQSGLNGVHTYTQGGTYGVTITVTDADGASATAFKAVVVADPPGVGVTPITPPTDTPRGGGGGTGNAQLILDRVSVSKSKFGVVATGKKPDSRHGASLSLRLSAPAAVTVTFERARSGRKVKGKCKVGAKKGTRCTRYSKDGTITKSLPAGTADIALTGVLGSKKLAVGTHRVTVQAVGADGKPTAAKVLTITIVKVKK